MNLVCILLLSLVSPEIKSFETRQNLRKQFSHPLDPLSSAEVHATSQIIRRHNSTSAWIFNRIRLEEPPKSVLLKSYLKNFSPLNIPRKSFSVILASETLAAVEVIVNLSEGLVESWIELPRSLQPGTNRPDRNLAEDIAKDDVRVQERCRRLGWSNMTLVAADVWPIGYIGDRADLNPEDRLVQSFFYGQMFTEDNEYAHPFDFVVTIDLRNRRVVSVEDLPTCDGISQCPSKNSVPRRTANYDHTLLGGDRFLRKDLRPLKIRQAGASFQVQGHLVHWQKFQFRVGFNEREGLVIHHVGYNDNQVGQGPSNFRPLFYRLSLAETFIPYGNPRPPFHRKGAYDMGELDIGISANVLNQHEFCLGENVKFFDVFINDPHGEPLRLPRAICIFEQDNGILWRHTDFRTGKSATVRSQRLSVAFMATVGNYDYLFTWYFYQDGSIQYEVRLTGILSTNLVAPNNSPAGSGTLVAPQVNAQYHQHIFAVRMDPEVDGNANTVATLDVVPGSTSHANPYGQAFTTKIERLRTASQARSYGSHKTSRSWLMMSTNGTLNEYLGMPTSYKLIPKHHARFLLSKDSPLYDKAKFSEYDVWVTPYVDGQLYSGGRYLNNSGLPQWTREAGQRSIEETDVVLWHILRVDHLPRSEDWPTMPNEAAGFFLKPYNFFKKNPALDVPPPKRVGK